jgi:hypothetical protein
VAAFVGAVAAYVVLPANMAILSKAALVVPVKL